MALDRNTLLSLNKDPKSIDLHNLALAKMKNVHVDNTARHAFIKDRQRTKNIKNIDQLYEKLNELEKNGVMDIWINKFGKKKYQGGVGTTASQVKDSLRESIEITQDVLLENNSCTLVLDKACIVQALHENLAAPAAGMTTASSGGAPIAPMGSEYTKEQPHVITISPTEKTHQDVGAQKRKGH